MMMRLFCAWLLLAAAAVAKTPAPASPAEVLPAMWEVRDEDTVITLFGSVHVLPRSTRWFAPPVVRALDAADTLVLEAVIPETAAGMMPVLLRLSRAPVPVPLTFRVPYERRAALTGAMQALRTGPLDAYKTWYAALAIASADNERRGLNPRFGVEAILTARARLKAKPVEGLESYEQQLTYFDALPEREQVVMLLSTLDDLGEADARMKRLVEDWLAGRTDALAAVLNEEFEGAPEARRILLEDRNKRWAAWVAERMKRPGRVFLAVGAGHLAGAGSVVEALKAYGLTATRVVDATEMRAPGPLAPARRRR